METKVCHVIKLLDKLSEKNVIVLVQEEHDFQKWGTMCPLATGAPKKPGLEGVKQ